MVDGKANWDHLIVLLCYCVQIRQTFLDFRLFALSLITKKTCPLPHSVKGHSILANNFYILFAQSEGYSTPLKRIPNESMRRSDTAGEIREEKPKQDNLRNNRKAARRGFEIYDLPYCSFRRHHACPCIQPKHAKTPTTKAMKRIVTTNASLLVIFPPHPLGQKESRVSLYLIGP